MASWQNIKHEPSSINGGNQYEEKDRVSKEQLNAITENAFYAVEKADEALDKANSAFEGNGTLVTIDGVRQSTWSADFAESERQKSLGEDGAIVHENDIADVEHIETVYDMTSSDSSINWGYTSGIIGLTSVENKDFSKYKKLIVHSYSIGISLETDIDLTNEHPTRFVGSAVGLSSDNIDLQCIKCKVDSTKTTFTVQNMGFYNTNGFNERNSGGGYMVFKIEGVY